MKNQELPPIGLPGLDTTETNSTRAFTPTAGASSEAVTLMASQADAVPPTQVATVDGGPLPPPRPPGKMPPTHVAFVGGGFTGGCALAGLVRASVDAHCTNLHITLYERSPDVATGLAYGIGLPDQFTLNHEFDNMGSVNVQLRAADKTDFYRWVQKNLDTFTRLYPKLDLQDSQAFVPRSLYRHYLKARFEETVLYAARHGIIVTARHSTEVTDIIKVGRRFVVFYNGMGEVFDRVVLATGNWQDKPGKHFDAAGCAFQGHQWQQFLRPDAKEGEAVMLVSGMGLTALDTAILALESGKYKKVVLSSRRGNLRHVRGRVAKYEREFFTLGNLHRMAGEGQPIRLGHILKALGDELEKAYGRPIPLKESHSPRETLAQLRAEVKLVESGSELKWRSVIMSMADDERQSIYERMTPGDQAEFRARFYQVFLSFQAPMPLSKAKALLGYIDEGKLEIVGGAGPTLLNLSTGKVEFEHLEDGQNAVLPGPGMADSSPTRKKHPLHFDIYVLARGAGRDLKQIPLYRKMGEKGLVEFHPEGGIRVETRTRRVIVRGRPHKHMYAIGQMGFAETILTHNSNTLSRLGIEVGKQIVSTILQKTRPRSHVLTIMVPGPGRHPDHGSITIEP